MLNRLEYDVGRDDLSANRPPTIVTKRFAVVVTRDSIFDLYDVVDQGVPASRHKATPIINNSFKLNQFLNRRQLIDAKPDNLAI